MHNILYICQSNYKYVMILESGSELFPCSFLFLKGAFENSKIAIKSGVPRNHKRNWNSMGKKQRLCDMPIPCTQCYYSNKKLTKARIFMDKKKSKVT